MRFGNPEYFLLLAALPLLALFFFLVYRRKKVLLSRFAAAPLVRKLSSAAGPARYILKCTFFCLFFAFAVFALVRPKFGVKMEMVERRGVDIMIALDISHSMLAQDLAPNRLERAKLETRKFISLFKGDRVGLIIFAGESFVQCPLTLDRAAVALMLESLGADWVQVQGTALAEVMRQAVRAMGGQGKRDRVLVILSDGEDHEGNVAEAAKAAARDGIVIYTIGIGSEAGVPIPVNRGGSVAYKKDKNGNLAMTRLNPVTLEKIAIETGGKYFHAGTDLDLTRIYNEISKMEKSDFGMSKAVVHEEQYQIFLLLAVIFILIEFVISGRARKKAVWRGRFE
jgi:Ca-activated chloride channel family protein